MPIIGFIIFGCVVAFCIRILHPSHDPDRSGIAGYLGSVLGAILGGTATVLLGGDQSASWIGSILGAIVLGYFDEHFFPKGLPLERCRHFPLSREKEVLKLEEERVA